MGSCEGDGGEGVDGWGGWRESAGSCVGSAPVGLEDGGGVVDGVVEGKAEGRGFVGDGEVVGSEWRRGGWDGSHMEEDGFVAVEGLVCGLLEDLHGCKEGLGIVGEGGGKEDFCVVRVLRGGDTDSGEGGGGC